MTSLVDLFFGCLAEELQFPYYEAKKVFEVSRITGMYVVCLDCGREFYDWKTMKVVGREKWTIALCKSRCTSARPNGDLRSRPKPILRLLTVDSAVLTCPRR